MISHFISRLHVGDQRRRRRKIKQRHKVVSLALFHAEKTQQPERERESGIYMYVRSVCVCVLDSKQKKKLWSDWAPFPALIHESANTTEPPYVYAIFSTHADGDEKHLDRKIK